MRFYLFFLLLLFINFTISAQRLVYRQVDSLKHALFLAEQDKDRVLLLSQLGEAFRRTQSDSAMFYGNQALTLARQIRFHKGEAQALLLLSWMHRNLGDLPYALDLALDALQISKLHRLDSEEKLALLRAGLVYNATKNYSKALSYFRQAEDQLKETPEVEMLATIHMSIGSTYEEMNELDSASYYIELLYPTLDQYELLPPLVLRIRGNIQNKLQDVHGALSYYQQALQAALKNKDIRAAADVSNDMAVLYRKLNDQDSAIYFSQQGLAFGQELGYEDPILESSTLLAELYDPGDPEQALKYHKIAKIAQESLYGSEKVQKLQSIMIEEQDRQRAAEATKIAYQNRMKQISLLAGLGMLTIVALYLYRNNKQRQKAFMLLQEQKEEIERHRDQLKATQNQLIQSEKMASLGELTAGIAHEIQNPLNFMNNFSEINSELITEMMEEAKQGNMEEVKLLAGSIGENEKKIHHHGQRADAIVKGMLQHSRTSSGQKELTDINALTDEFLKLSYHGLRAKDSTFNSTMKTNYDGTLGAVQIIPQDIGRVLLNIFNNAFYSVNEKNNKLQSGHRYEPTVSVNTTKLGNKAEIRIRDNGNGIPEGVLNKIFQPFFTTKPTGQGTGLGLSLSYDIVRAHGGELKVNTREGEYAEFIIILPL